MQYRRLGDAGVKLSEIGLGGWLTFDNANVYARGRCEEVWGELLKDRRRDACVLATKVYFPMGEGPNDRGLSRKHIMEQCHASLRRLGTDYIDLYQCHRYDPDAPLEETLRALDD